MTQIRLKRGEYIYAAPMTICATDRRTATIVRQLYSNCDLLSRKLHDDCGDNIWYICTCVFIYIFIKYTDRINICEVDLVVFVFASHMWKYASYTLLAANYGQPHQTDGARLSAYIHQAAREPGEILLAPYYIKHDERPWHREEIILCMPNVYIF